MDLTSRISVKNLLKEQGVRPFKGLGQNFLVDKRVLEKIIEAAGLEPDDVVLEIGPGIGTLTQELAKRVKKVIAVEKDQKMIEILKETLQGFNNIEVMKGDILKIENLKIENYKVVANLPYYIVAPVIRKFLEMKEAKPLSLILMVQKEVGQRIYAKPPKMNLLAVAVQFYAQPEIISYVSKKSFWPQPKVDAAVIKIVPRRSAYGSASFRERFFKIVKAGFSQPRKQILNNLSKNLELDKEKTKSWLLENNIRSTQRAENLSVENWLNLTKTFGVV